MAAPKFSYELPPPPVGTARTFEETVDAGGAAGTGTFAPGQTMYFDIPTGRRNTYLDPSKTWLEIMLRNDCLDDGDDSAAAQLDGSGHALIKNLRLMDRPGGTVLEEIGEANALAHLYVNGTAKPEDLYGYRSAGEGFLSARLGTNYETTSSVTFVSPSVATGGYQGQIFESTGVDTGVGDVGYANGNTQTLGLPLLSTIGVLGNKYIPVHRLVRPMRMDVELAPASEVFNSTAGSILPGTIVVDGNQEAYGVDSVIAPYPGAGTLVDVANYSVLSAKLHLTYVQLDDSTQKTVDEATNGTYTWATQTYTHFRNQCTLTSTALSMPPVYIRGRHSSARAVQTVLRQASARSSTTNLYTSSFPRNHVSTAYYRLGDKPVPQRPMSSLAHFAKAFSEVYASYHPSAARGGTTNLITWSKQQPFTADGDNPGSFSIAADLGGPCGNAFDTVMGGAQTLGQDITLHMTLSEPWLADTTFTVDSYVLHDALFTIDDKGNFTVAV